MIELKLTDDQRKALLSDPVVFRDELRRDFRRGLEDLNQYHKTRSQDLLDHYQTMTHLVDEEINDGRVVIRDSLIDVVKDIQDFYHR